MDFRTKVELPASLPPVTHAGQILLLGSCFAENMGRQLAVKIAFRQLVAVGHYPPRFFLFIDVGGAESQHQPIQLMNRLIGLLQTMIYIPDDLARRSCGE